MNRKMTIATRCLTVLCASVLTGCAATAASEELSSVPDVETKFLALVADGQKAAKDNNDVKLVGQRKDRNEALCQLFGEHKTADGWIGEVSDLRTTMGGDRGVLSIELADDVEVGTWNNSVSDISSRTLIDTADPLYAVMADLEKGDKVRFSGDFVADDENCIREKSLTDRGGMRTPSFIMKFTALEQIS